VARLSTGLTQHSCNRRRGPWALANCADSLPIDQATMHHPQVNSDEERRPLFVSQPLQPSDYHTLEKSHLVSTSTPSNTNDINSALRSDGRNTSDSETEDDSDDGDLSSDQSSASSIALDTSIANEEAPFQGSGSSTLFGRRHSRRRLSYRLQMLLTVLSQLGILVFFGTLAGVIAKAPWVYPYSWHPICMGLYGFLATEGLSDVLEAVAVRTPFAPEIPQLVLT